MSNITQGTSVQLLPTKSIFDRYEFGITTNTFIKVKDIDIKNWLSADFVALETGDLTSWTKDKIERFWDKQGIDFYNVRQVKFSVLDSAGIFMKYIKIGIYESSNDGIFDLKSLILFPDGFWAVPTDLVHEVQVNK
jgi:hypothetical protein